MPSKEKTGGKVSYIQKQTGRLCIKTVEEGNTINTKTMTYETEQSQDDNPYKKVVLSKVLEGKTNPQK